MKTRQPFVVDGKTIGYAINLLLLFQASQGFAALSGSSMGAENFRVFYQWPLAVALICGLLALAARCRSGQYAPARPAVLFATVCTLAGTLLAVVTPVAQLPANIAASVTAVALGVGLAFSFALWQRTLARDGLEQARPKVILGTALASLIDIALAQGQGSALLSLVMAAVALTNGCLLLQNALPARSRAASANPESTPTMPRLLRSIWRYILCVGVIGFASRTSQALAAQEAGASMNVFMAVAMLASALVMVLIWLWGRPLSLPRAFTVLSALVTAGFLSLLVVPNAAVPFIAAFGFFAFSLISMLMVLVTIEIAASRTIDPTFVFGTFTGFAYLVSDAGPLLTSTLETHFALSPITVVSVSAIYLVAFAGLVVNVTKNGGAKAGDVPSEEEPAVDLSSNFVRPVVVQQDIMLLCCRILQKRYQLTTRETEILELLARGRDLARMADVLFVSQNTIRSHTRNLYKKLDVHSKQEALDLLEQAREEVVGVPESSK